MKTYVLTTYIFTIYTTHILTIYIYIYIYTHIYVHTCMWDIYAYIPSLLWLIQLIFNDGEHSFICLLAICIYSLKKSLFRSFDNFKGSYLSFIIEL